MSALGQKQTSGHVHVMSALPPKADIEPRRLGARYWQNRHDFHGISRKDREVRMPLEQLSGGVMRFRANYRVAAHQVAYVFNALLAHLFGLAERTAHGDDCSVVLFDPRFPGRDALLHLCVSRLLGKGVPGCHTRAGFVTEEDGEKRIVRAHNVSFCSTVFCEASTLVSACLTFGSESGLLTTPASRPFKPRKALPRRLRQCRGCMVLKSSLHC